MTSDTLVRLTGLVLPALVTAAQFGPFFSWEPWSPDAGWRPWAALSDGDVVAERVSIARDTLIGMFGLPADDVPVRVVASVTFLGYASRVVSPLLGAAVAGGDLPTPESAKIWWRPQPGGPLPIAYGNTPARPCTQLDVTALAEALAEVAVSGLLGPVLEAFRERFTLSPKVLWGNVASALGGAVGMIARAGTPDQAERAAGTVEAMLTIGPLTGTATLVRPSRSLVRHNCCLYYRIPGGGTCGDCVLRSRATA